MKKNKLVSIALAMGLALTPAGCGSKSSSSSYEPHFTTAELTEKISICGKQLKYPFTAADLGDEFHLDSYAQQSSDCAMIDIFNKDGIVCTFQYKCAAEEVDKDKPVSGILFTPNDFNKDAVSIDGFTVNDNISVLKEKLGEPEPNDSGLVVYPTKDNGRLEVLAHSSGTVSSINFIMDPNSNSALQDVSNLAATD